MGADNEKAEAIKFFFPPQEVLSKQMEKDEKISYNLNLCIKHVYLSNKYKTEKARERKIKAIKNQFVTMYIDKFFCYIQVIINIKNGIILDYFKKKRVNSCRLKCREKTGMCFCKTPSGDWVFPIPQIF